MDLYLVQHGEAKPEQEDPARPLTEQGRRDVGQVARAAARAGLQVVCIVHSGKLRARETAEILAGELHPPGGVAELAGLAPMDDPTVAQRAVARLAEPTMLVGHLPHLSRLASLLLVGDPGHDVVAFRMGAIVCLANQEGRWRVKWILAPELVP